MASEEESIEQAAAARRERLKALRAAQELLNSTDGDSAPQADDNGTDEELCVFSSYFNALKLQIGFRVLRNFVNFSEGLFSLQ